MGLRHFRVRQLLPHLGVALLYPVYAFVTSDGSWVRLADAMTVVGLIFLILGVVWYLVMKGDFDITGYVLRRGMRGTGQKTFADYRREKEEQRREMANYPLLTGIALLLASALIALLV